MKVNKRIFLSIFWIILGAVLSGLGVAGTLDEYWSGMGSALLVIGVLQVIKYIRLSKNEAYREKMEIELTDERNRFIRSKAWAWAGYLFILITAVSAIVLKLVGQELLSMAAGFAVCLMLILYYVSYMMLSRKY